MFDIVPGVGWLLLAYVVGTAYGWWVNRSGAEVTSSIAKMQRVTLKS